MPAGTRSKAKAPAQELSDEDDDSPTNTKVPKPKSKPGPTSKKTTSTSSAKAKGRTTAKTNPEEVVLTQAQYKELLAASKAVKAQNTKTVQEAKAKRRRHSYSSICIKIFPT